MQLHMRMSNCRTHSHEPHHASSSAGHLRRHLGTMHPSMRSFLAASALPLLLLLLLLSAPDSSQAQLVNTNGCSAILRAGVYRSFYQRGDGGPYATFESAVCSLPSTDLHELVLPLSPEAQAAFSTAAAVLVPRWQDTEGSLNGPGLSTSSAYKVVRDYHTATCKVRHCVTHSGKGGGWLLVTSSMHAVGGKLVFPSKV